MAKELVQAPQAAVGIAGILAQASLLSGFLCAA